MFFSTMFPFLLQTNMSHTVTYVQWLTVQDEVSFLAAEMIS